MSRTYYLVDARITNVSQFMARTLSFIVSNKEINQGIQAEVLEVESGSKKAFFVRPDKCIKIMLTPEDQSIEGVDHEVWYSSLDEISDIVKTTPKEIFTNLFKGSPQEGSEVSLFLYRNETDIDQFLESEAVKEIKSVIVPVFTRNSYRALREKVHRNKVKNVYAYHVNSIPAFAKLMNTTNEIIGSSEGIVKLATLLYTYFETGEMPETGKDLECIGDEKFLLYVHEPVKKSTKGIFNYITGRMVKAVSKSSIVETPIYTFLVPSYGKRCGIGDYHKFQKEDMYNVSVNNPLCLTYKRLDDIQDYTDTIFIHHEYSLFADSYLAEDTYSDLENYITNEKKKKFVVFFHSVPHYDDILNNQIALSIARISVRPNVTPVVFNQVMKDQLDVLMDHVGFKGKKSKTEILELGLYRFNSLIDGVANGLITLIGFNSFAKKNNEAIDYIMKNTNHNMLVCGVGSTVLKNQYPSRIEAYDEYLDDFALMNLLNLKSSMILCHRDPKATSSSGSYRYALSTGLPVLGADVNAHSSFFDNTKESKEPFLLYTELEEIPALIDKARDEQYRANNRSYILELVNKYSIGKITEDFIRAIS
jgi:hypothetical protein